MERGESTRTIYTQESTSFAPNESYPVGSCVFRHQDLIFDTGDSKPVDKKNVTNTLNFMHFQGEHLLANLRHPDYRDSILLKAYPEPCLGEEVTCRWPLEMRPDTDLRDWKLQHLVIDKGKDLLMIPATMWRVNSECLRVKLPETSYAIERRKAMRYLSRNVGVELSQGALEAKGELLDFNAFAFRVSLESDSLSAVQSCDLDAPFTVCLKKNQQAIFEGPCRFVRQGEGSFHGHIVLAPAQKEIRRFDKKSTRNPRQQLKPPAILDFDHPLCEKRFQGEVFDISTSGFSLYEQPGESSLVAGMVIPGLTISFGGALKMKCKAQVIYRSDEADNGFRYGLAILDMDIDSYSLLAHLLVSSKDPYAQISNRVDMNRLWEFFFDTGFVYPKKYGQIQSKKDTLRETYRKLYEECPEISRHFIYQKGGRIYSHISMVRAYERAWLIQHQAARPLGGRSAGLAVLKHIIYYLKDMHRFPSLKMGYMMVYFRPENKFPDRVFGGFARYQNDPRICSMDLFCYLPYTTQSLVTDVPQGWSVKESSAADLRTLSRFYSTHSGGLLMDALALGQKGLVKESLGEVYDRLGFCRKWRIYSLKHGEELKAVLILNQSDLGVNLSELLNSIKVLVTSPTNLPWNILSMAIGKLIGTYRMEKVPIMFYPTEYVRANSIPYEKQYQLWIYNARHVDLFMEYVQRKFRVRYE